jgi:peptidyl-dipeptidase A
MPTGPPSARERHDTFATFAARLTAELEPLQRRHNLAVWEANVSGDRAAEARAAELDTEMRVRLSRRDDYAWLEAVAAAGGVDDPALDRQLTLLRNAFRGHQVAPDRIAEMVRIEKQLESRFNHFRATLDGVEVGDNQLRAVLRGSDDPAERRRAWEASKQIGAEVAAPLRHLVGLRNEAARSIGFSDYWTMRLTLDEVDPVALIALFDDLDRGTRPLWERYRRDLDARLARRFGIGAADVRPWHLGDPFFQEAPPAGVDLDRHFAGRNLEELTARFFAAVGFEIGPLLARADLYEKPGKCQHAFCLSIDRRDDVRVLCNVLDNEYWMGTMLHEFGHAVYDAWIDPELPWLLREPAHTFTTEASAMLFGRLTKNSAWLERWAGVPRDEARAAADACARATREQLLVQTRWELVMVHMERELYRDPSQDLDALWWDLVERYQWVKRPEGRSAPDWAAKIHFSVAPAYYHSYQLGEMFASQLQAHLLEQIGGGFDAYVASPEVGRFLTERLYRPGRLRDGWKAVEHAVGAPLSAPAFVSELAGA